jgi:hypothetical protein
MFKIAKGGRDCLNCAKLGDIHLIIYAIPSLFDNILLLAMNKKFKKVKSLEA